MTFKRGRFVWFQFVLYGVRVRESTKQENDAVARTMEGRYRSQLSDAVGVGPKAELKRRLIEYLEAERAKAKEIDSPAPPPVTFRMQAESWIASLPVRRRKPVKPATIAGWQHALSKWILPNLGDRPLSEVGNGTLRQLVEKLAEKKLSPKTIVNYSQVVKLVVASAVDAEGKRVYPREWNHEFVGIPIVQKGEQDSPTVTEAELQDILAATSPRYAVLIALLAGTGIRIGEALALKSIDFSQEGRVLRVQRSIWRGKEQDPKTSNAVREIDIAEPLARLLDSYIGGKLGYLFNTASGRPLSQRNVLRALHATGKKIGLHAFRRFRAETLRRAPAPEDLVIFWLGHAPRTVTDDYARGLRENLTWRREQCDRVGLGFSLDGLLGPQNVVAINSGNAA